MQVDARNNIFYTLKLHIFYTRNSEIFRIKSCYCVTLCIWNCTTATRDSKNPPLLHGHYENTTFQRGIISIAFYWADLAQWNALKYFQRDYETLSGTNRESCLFEALYWTVTKWNRDTRETTQFTEANLDLLHPPLEENSLA